MDFNGVRALVLDGYGRQIPSVLQQLSELGCIITTVSCSKCDPGYASKYPAKKILLPDLNRGGAAMEQLIDAEICSGNYDVVIPILEKSTEYIVKNADKYSEFVKIAAAPYSAFIMAYDKEETLRVCQDIGVPCPLTKMDDETLETYLSKARFPLALKPRKGTGSIGFHRVDAKDELYELISSGKINVEQYVIQEFIPQDDIQYVCDICVDGNGDLKSAVAAEKIRWFPTDGGAACFLKAVERPDIVELSYKLLKAIGWVGFCAVSYINDPRDNVPKILEINGRIPAGVRLCPLCGIKIIRQMLELAFDAPVSEYKTDIGDGVCLRYLHTDILWFIKSKKRFKTKPGWFNFARNHDYIFSWKDPLPFFAYSFRGIARYRTEMDRRKR